MAEDDARVVQAMQQFGGSFVRALGALWPLADDENRARLKTAFPEYWITYRDLAILKAEQAVPQ